MRQAKIIPIMHYIVSVTLKYEPEVENVARGQLIYDKTVCSQAFEAIILGGKATVFDSNRFRSLNFLRIYFSSISKRLAKSLWNAIVPIPKIIYVLRKLNITSLPIKSKV